MLDVKYYLFRSLSHVKGPSVNGMIRPMLGKVNHLPRTFCQIKNF